MSLPEHKYLCRKFSPELRTNPELRKTFHFLLLFIIYLSSNSVMVFWVGSTKRKTVLTKEVLKTRLKCGLGKKWSKCWLKIPPKWRHILSLFIRYSSETYLSRTLVPLCTRRNQPRWTLFVRELFIFFFPFSSIHQQFEFQVHVHMCS